MTDPAWLEASPWADVVEAPANLVSAPSLTLMGVAIASTALMSPTGADHALRLGFARDLASPKFASGFGDAMVSIGWVLPVLPAFALYTEGILSKNSTRARAGAMTLSAVGTTMVWVTLLKVVTGRPYPLHGGSREDPARFDYPEYAKEWRPFREGHVAWPSGHTATAFAAASALSWSTENVWVTVLSHLAAGAVGAGMLLGDHHWASDVLAGALMGEAIGYSFGKRPHKGTPGTSWTAAPMTGRGVTGLTLVWTD
jgi:membrane-associated phospholipid phosphatase